MIVGRPAFELVAAEMVEMIITNKMGASVALRLGEWLEMPTRNGREASYVVSEGLRVNKVLILASCLSIVSQSCETIALDHSRISV